MSQSLLAIGMCVVYFLLITLFPFSRDEWSGSVNTLHCFTYPISKEEREQSLQEWEKSQLPVVSFDKSDSNKGRGSTDVSIKKGYHLFKTKDRLLSSPTPSVMPKNQKEEHQSVSILSKQPSEVVKESTMFNSTTSIIPRNNTDDHPSSIPKISQQVSLKNDTHLSIKELTPSNSSQPYVSQQKRLDKYLEKMLAKQEKLTLREAIVLYEVHPESGIGNMIRGYLTGLVIASLTKRGLMISSYADYVTDYFISPFPNMCFPGSTDGYKRYTWSFIPTMRDLPAYNNIHISKQLRTRNIRLNTYSDYTSLAFNPSLYQDAFYKMGLVDKVIPNRDAFSFGWEVRSIWLRLMMNPNENLCNIINKHIIALKQRYIIGVQLRLGGSKANFHERVMLPESGIERAENKIRNHVKKMKLKWDEVYVFISTDSDYAARKIRRDFNHNSTRVVYTANDFDIGHSAQAKTSKQGKKVWSSFTKRAIIDMMILKESDYYIYSKRSSFGKFALELQQSYNITVNVDRHLYSRGLKCSVFHKREKVGLADYV